MNEFDINKRILDFCYNKEIDLFELSQISGVSYHILLKIEKNEISPDLEMVEKICVALDITLAQFFDMSTPKNNIEEFTRIYINLSKKKQTILRDCLYFLCQEENPN